MITKIVFFAVFAFYLADSSAFKTCDLRPTGMLTPKSNNPHPFKVVFKGNVESYVPGLTYTSNTFLLSINKFKKKKIKIQFGFKF